MSRIGARLPGVSGGLFEDLGIVGSLSFWKGGEITTTANGNLTLIPNGSGITIVGDAGSTSRSLASNDDLLVTGRAEVNGVFYADSDAYFTGVVRIEDDTKLVFGDDDDFKMEWATNQATSGALMLGLGVNSRYILMTDLTQIGKNHDHPNQDHPTLFIHAFANPDTDNTPWISFKHDNVDGDINCGKGTLNLSSAAGAVNFKTATLTGSTVTHDAYVELEVAGVLKKFMLGS